MKNKLFRSPLTCLALVILLMSSCGKQQPLPTPILITATPYSVAVYKDMAYTSERNLDVYAPSTPGNWPVVVLFNGTSKEAYVQLSSAIAAQGAVVFNPDIPTKPSNFSPVEHISQGWRMQPAPSDSGVLRQRNSAVTQPAWLLWAIRSEA